MKSICSNIIRRHDTQNNDIQHNYTHHNSTHHNNVLIYYTNSIKSMEFDYAERRIVIVMLNVVMLSVIVECFIVLLSVVNVE